MNIMCWNSEGWSGPNCRAKQELVYRLNAGVVLLVETWAQHYQDITLDGYTCYNKLRTLNNKKVCRGSGGLSFAIKNSLLDTYMIKPEFSPMDEVHIMNMKDKNSDFTIRLYGIYIAPENSVYGHTCGLRGNHRVPVCRAPATGSGSGASRAPAGTRAHQ